MTKKEIKKALLEIKKERGYIGEGLQDLLNLTYWVAVNRCDKTLSDVNDLIIIFDNLFINSEIIDNDNVNEYEDYIQSKTRYTFEHIKEQVKSGYFYLLDFYYISCGTWQHAEKQFLKFTSGYNVL